MTMHYSDDDYPHDYESVPSLIELLQTIDWDTLLVFDACRWDAFETVCGESDPVRAPGFHTSYWVETVIGNDEMDWRDVAYISGNPFTTVSQNVDHVSTRVVEEVAEYVEAFENDTIWDANIGTADPDELTRLAENFTERRVVHYMQPHTPFIGSAVLSMQTGFDEFVINPFEDHEKGSELQYLAKNGHISPELYRTAYLENLARVWEASEPLRESSDRVVITADHGEMLGPDTFSHGGPYSNQTRVVPFYTTWDVDLPTAETLQTDTVHEWETAHDESLSASDT